MSISIAGPDPYSIQPVEKKDEAGNVIAQDPIKTGVNKISLAISFTSTIENFTNYLDALKKDDAKISINSWSYEVKDGTMKCSLIVHMYCA